LKLLSREVLRALHEHPYLIALLKLDLAIRLRQEKKSDQIRQGIERSVVTLFAQMRHGVFDEFDVATPDQFE